MRLSTYRLRCRLRLLDGFLQPPHDFGLGLRAYNAIDLLPRLQHQQRGNAANVKALRSDGIFIYVQFRHANSPGHLFGELFHYRRNHLARSAPGGPQIQQHRQRRALNISRERRVRYGDGMDGNGQWILATPANRRQSLLDLFQRHSIGGAANGATNELRFSHSGLLPTTRVDRSVTRPRVFQTGPSLSWSASAESLS